MKKLVLTIASFSVAINAFPFCGFYVAKADTKLFNKTSQIILVRDGEKTTITVFNKIDAADQTMLQRARRLAPDALFVSAQTRAGLDTLEARCLELIAETHAATELVVPHTRYDVIARLHAIGHVQAEEQCDDGVHLRGRFPPAQAAYFAPFVVTK